MSAVTNRVDEEVRGDSNHILIQVYRVLSDMVGRLKKALDVSGLNSWITSHHALTLFAIEHHM